jgi:hypothetical protein
MHWVITVFDREGREVKSSYFDGTEAQMRSHIKLDYRRDRGQAPSGAQRYFPADRYRIEAQPNAVVFHVAEDAEYDN